MMETLCMFVCHVHQDSFRYVLLVWTRIFDIYVCQDIIRAFLFLWCRAMCNALSPIMSGPWGTYMSLPGGSICVYVGRVCVSTTHQTLPGTKKSSKLCDSFKIVLNHVMRVIPLLNPRVG